MKNILLHDKFILTLIIINALIIFIESFDGLDSSFKSLFILIDIIITIIFVFEIIVKIKIYTFQKFFHSLWNKFDFFIVAFSLFSIILLLMPIQTEDFSFIIVLRLARLFKIFRSFKFIPNIEKLLDGLKRALKASSLVLLSLLVYNFILGIISCHLFKDIAPEYFGNPINSLYTIFKIFTVEGWYEIPEIISKQTSEIFAIFTITFFVLVLLSGGIIGISLINSIFVDEMVADNNDELEEKVQKLSEEISKLNKLIFEFLKKE